MYTSAM